MKRQFLHRLLQSGAAIMAVPILILFASGKLEPTPPPAEPAAAPHPSEVVLLEELSAWAAPTQTDSSFLAEILRGTDDEQAHLRVEELPFGGSIWKAAQEFEVDALLLASIVEAESQFDAEAVSPKGALGLMQVLPSSVADFGPVNLADPTSNLKAGARYFSKMLKRHDGDLALALAAYNAGPTNVRRFGGVPPFAETRHYVNKVMRLYHDHLEALWLLNGFEIPTEDSERAQLRGLESIEGPFEQVLDPTGDSLASAGSVDSASQTTPRQIDQVGMTGILDPRKLH